MNTKAIITKADRERAALPRRVTIFVQSSLGILMQDKHYNTLLQWLKDNYKNGKIIPPFMMF